MIRRDPVTGAYWTLSNINTNISYTDQRNVLVANLPLLLLSSLSLTVIFLQVLCMSLDLFNWTAVSVLLADDTGLSPQDSVRYTGFQFVAAEMIILI